ncbi:MAG: MBL fold metallo-hydrolase [Cyclobacteriaceae bacterium]|nr:MBL fold metallo-hydrolase [Cyclobacteriaceae bacterium]
MNIHSFVFNPFYENTYVIHVDGLAWIIDPGCYEKHEQKQLDDFILSANLKPVAVINTHCHIDHVLGNAYVKDKYGIPLWIPAGELDMLRAVTAYGPNWGITGYQEAEPDRLLEENDQLELNGVRFEIRLAPGHSPGHLVYYQEASQVLIAGDVLFRESIGRTDLPGGDPAMLEKSIREKIYNLPGQVTVYPGHGPTTTISHEKMYNPFINERS